MKKKKKKDICSFKKFLVREHVFNTFVKNIEHKDNYFKRDFHFENLKQYFECEDLIAQDFLSYSFDWSNSLQGHNFWEKLDYKWRQLLREKKYRHED